MPDTPRFSVAAGAPLDKRARDLHRGKLLLLRRNIFF